MAVNNSLVAKQNQRLGLTAYLTQDAVKNQINSVIGGKDGQKISLTKLWKISRSQMNKLKKKLMH